MPDTPLTADLRPLALIVPLFVWDLYQLWSTPGWRETATHLLRIDLISGKAGERPAPFFPQIGLIRPASPIPLKA